jgi:hypothetical protein
MAREAGTGKQFAPCAPFAAKPFAAPRRCATSGCHWRLDRRAQARLKIFSAIPADFAFPFLCVQHIGKGFWRTGRMARFAMSRRSENRRRRRGSQSRRRFFGAKIVTSKSMRAGGSTFPRARFRWHRPSVSKLLEAVARVCGDRAIAVLLTEWAATARAD